MSNRSELVLVRDAVIRYFHDRATLDELRVAAIARAKAMAAGGMTMEEILIVLKGAVRLAAEHVSSPGTEERAVWLRSQMTQWLVAMYLDDASNAADSEPTHD